MQRRTFIHALVALATLSLAGAGQAADILKVGATAGPHEQILDVVKKVAEKDGLGIQGVIFSDYIQPNAALASGDLDLNTYQHQPFLDAQVRDRGYKLVAVGEAVRQQFGIYSKKIKALKDLPVGAKVGIPNDPSNGARALLVFAHQGLIKLKPGSGIKVSLLDIVENPKKIKFVELEAAQLPRSLDDLDAAAVNSNYAVPAGLSPSKDAIALESPKSPFATIIVVAREQNRNDPRIQKFLKAYRSPEVKAFVDAQFKGAYTASW